MNMGIVVALDHKERRFTSRMVPSSNGNETTYVPKMVIDPEEWKVLIEEDAPNGEKVQTWHPITEQEYNTLKIGDSWSSLTR